MFSKTQHIYAKYQLYKCLYRFIKLVPQNNLTSLEIVNSKGCVVLNWNLPANTMFPYIHSKITYLHVNLYWSFDVFSPLDKHNKEWKANSLVRFHIPIFIQMVSLFHLTNSFKHSQIFLITNTQQLIVSSTTTTIFAFVVCGSSAPGDHYNV